MPLFRPLTALSIRPVATGALSIALFLALTIVAPATAHADIVVLENGNEIQCEVLREGPESVVVRFPGGTMRLDRDHIREIRRQSRDVYLLEEGQKAGRRGDYESAIETLERARVEDPDSERIVETLNETRLQYAHELASTRRYEEAMHAFEVVLEADPESSEAQSGVELVTSAREESRREVEQARSEVRRGDLETSRVRLERLFRGYPDLREDVRSDLAQVYLRLGVGHARAQRWTQAADLLYEAATVSPERVSEVRAPFVTCLLRRIDALATEGDFAAIEPVARRGLEVDPESAVLNYWLGLSLEATSRERQAVRVYRALLAGQSGPSLGSDAVSLRERVESELLRSAPGSPAFLEKEAKKVLPGEFRTIARTRFVVRHRNTTIGREVARVAEKFYHDLHRRLGCSTHWRNACEIVVHPNRDAYLAASDVGSWSGASHRLTRRYGVFSRQRIDSYQDQPGLTTGVLQHEIAHALLSHRLNYPRTIPLWLNEGFAVAEGPEYLRRHYEELVGAELSRGRLIPSRQLIEADSYPDDSRVALFYAQSYGLVRFLLDRRGLPTFVAFAKSIVELDSDVDDALERHYGIQSVTALDNHWRTTAAR